MNIVRYTYPARSLAPSFGFARSPWRGLETEIDRMFGSVLSDLATPARSESRFPVDLYGDKENTYVRAELPGVDRKDINVEIVDGYLTITARRESKTTEGDGQESVSFSRSIDLQDDVQTDKVAAAYENGVLTVTLPKKEEAKPKKVTVSVN
ncbi:MAG TPA: Hsp20/alpha crystallin family protein [Opitutaceae bacterium]|nr:Hsp20/alpha crystallin family protein [Opitutaceae bacterium]